MTREEKLIDICAEVLMVEPQKLSLDTTRDEVDTFDSLAIVMIVSELCNALQITVRSEKIDMTKIEKIADFLKLLD